MRNKLQSGWHRLAGSLWFVPALIVAGAIGLAALMVELSARTDPEALARFPRLFGAGAEGARSMLAAIAGSMITVAGVTFSITVLAVAQASSQYTPRILRNFMRDRANQVVLGGLAGIFVYCLVVLRTIRAGDELHFIPAIAVLLAVGLAVLGIGFLVFFIHHITETLEAGSILARIARETVRAVDRLFPQELGQRPVDDEPDTPPPAVAALDSAAWHALPAAATGYLQQVDGDGLLRYAEERGVVVRMERGIGEFAIEGMPLASITGAHATAEDARALNALFTLSSYRTVQQDAAFGIRQIVDIAVKALSPGVNDTTTAVSCVDHLGAVLVRLARRRVAEPYRMARGEVRVLARGPTFESLVNEALDEIRQNASGNVSVLSRLLSVLESVVPVVTNPQRRTILLGHAELIRKTAERTITLEEDLAAVANGYSRLPPRLPTLGLETRLDQPVPGAGRDTG